MIKLIKIFFLIFVIIKTNLLTAKETLIYSDSIQYDDYEIIIAKGNAKIISDNQILISDLVILNQKEGTFILPKSFQFKDEKINYYYGSSGTFTKDLKNSYFKDVKIKLSDGSRIVGTSAKRNGDIDIISKGVYSPCQSRIKVGNFICPTWQLEGEKILHDNKNLFL